MCEESAAIGRVFLANSAERLRREGVEVTMLVLDTDEMARVAPLRHLWRLGRRQARIAGVSTVRQLARIQGYRWLTRRRSCQHAGPSLPEGLPIVRVPTLNSPTAIHAIIRAGCDLVCLMGARILTRRTLAGIGLPIINIHSSDPRWVRGGPVVVWEVLAGRPAITLVVHEVVEAVDAGAILAQGSQRVLYQGGLGATTEATMAAARPTVADLFERAIRDRLAGLPQRTPFQPGELRVTPALGEALRAERLCRVRTARARELF